MPSQIYWHVPEKVLYIKFTGALKPDSLLATADYAADMLTEASQGAHVIMDMRRVVGLNKNTMQLRNNLAPMITHNNLNWTVVMTSNLLLQAYLNRAAHRMTSRWGYVKNFAEAVSFVRQVDNTMTIIPVSLADAPRSAHLIR
ncbi:MAG: hypothetical protein ACPG7F_15465 [Aggregatilineales bacterium]